MEPPMILIELKFKDYFEYYKQRRETGWHFFSIQLLGMVYMDSN